MHVIFELFHENQILLLFLLVGGGMVFGHLKAKGIALGAAAVLFLAIGVAAWATQVGVELLIAPAIGTMGLAVFAFAIGITSGPTFFHTFKTALGPISVIIITLCLGAGAAVTLGKALGMTSAEIGGAFAGATTNTPALAAASEAAANAAKHAGADQATAGAIAGSATVGYAVTYIFGVIGMLFFAQLALNYRKHDKDAPTPLANRTIRVDRDDNSTIADLAEELEGKIVFSRLRRGETGPIARPKPHDILRKGDLLTVVGPADEINAVVSALGHRSSHSLMDDRSYLDFRRITVSDPKLSGRTIAQLALDEKFGATLSRVRRGDIDMAATGDLVLQEGDRVRVVAPTTRMREISKFFGDSTRGMSNINPIALGLGLALGIFLGELDIPLPNGSTFSIGAAAGSLLVGLVMGRIGRIGPVVTAIPYTACQVLSEFGLLIFLAYAGTKAGGQISVAFTSGKWISLALVGFAVTIIVGLGTYAIMRWVVKLGGTRTAGVLGGVQTQPAVLAFANARTGSDPRVALGYAMVYPVAMVTKIFLAQFVGGLG